MPPYTVFVAYIGNEYGMEVARFADQCLSEHDMLPHVALSGTRGEIHTISPHDIIEDGARCDGFLAINSEGAIDRRERLKFWIEVAKLLFTFYKPTVALLQDGEPHLHHLDNPEVRHVTFQKGRHDEVCDKLVTELKHTIENWAPAPDVPLGGELPARTVHGTT